MEFPAELPELLTEVLQKKFSQDEISEISIESIEIDHEAGEVRIELKISKRVAPEKFAEGYFGLTNLVHRSFKKNSKTLGEFFPIITPNFGQGVHA